LVVAVAEQPNNLAPYILQIQVVQAVVALAVQTCPEHQAPQERQVKATQAVTAFMRHRTTVQAVVVVLAVQVKQEQVLEVAMAESVLLHL
jgi:hypothetical protein